MAEIVSIKVKVGEKIVEMPTEEARQLLAELKQLFEKESVPVYIPYRPSFWESPCKIEAPDYTLYPQITCGGQSLTSCFDRFQNFS